jgi:hypothetical protein
MANRLWIFGTLVLIAGMLLGTYFIGIAPAMSAATTADRDAASVRALNVGQEQNLARLKEDFKNIDQLRADLKKLGAVIPTDADETPLLAQLHAMSVTSGARVDHITFEDPTAYVPGAPTDPEVVAAMGGVSSGNLLIIPVELKIIGTTAATVSFLRELQKGTRYFLAYDMTFEGTDDDLATDETLLTITGQIFVLTGAGSPVVTDPAADPAVPAN